MDVITSALQMRKNDSRRHCLSRGEPTYTPVCLCGSSALALSSTPRASPELCPLCSPIRPQEGKALSFLPGSRTRGIGVLVYHIVLLEPRPPLPLQSVFMVQHGPTVATSCVGSLFFWLLEWKLWPLSFFSTKKQHSLQTIISKVLLLWSSEGTLALAEG